MANGGDAGREDDVLEHNWRLACRVATAAGGLGAALAAALNLFVGVSAGMLVMAAAVTGLAIGLRLPPASPRQAMRKVRALLAV
jgi:hypothetical protein